MSFAPLAFKLFYAANLILSNVAALVFFPETYLGYVSGRPSDLCVLVSRRWPELRVAVSSGHRPTLGLGGDEGVVVVVGHAAQW